MGMFDQARQDMSPPTTSGGSSSSSPFAKVRGRMDSNGVLGTYDYADTSSNKSQQAAQVENQTPPDNPSSLLDSLSPSTAWKELKVIGSKMLEDLKNVPQTAGYPFAKIAEYATPDAPLIGTRPDGSYGNLPGTNARQAFVQANPTAPTGSPGFDKASDLIGQFVGPLVGTYGTGMGEIPGIVDNALTRAGVQFGDNLAGKIGKGVVEGALSGYPMNAAATLTTQDPSLSDLAQAGNQGALFGAGLGAGGALLAGGDAALGSATSKVAQRIRDQQALKQATQDFIDRTQAQPPAESAQPAFPSGRTVMDLSGSSTQPKGAELADNFNRSEEYQKQFQQAINDQYDYLKSSMQNRGGVDQGGVVRDAVTGDVTGRYGRISNNPPWYQDFFSANGRAPTDAELRDLAKQQVLNGFDSEVGRVPPWKPAEYADVTQGISDIKEALPNAYSDEEKAALNNTMTTLDSLRERYKGSLPEGVQPMQKGGISSSAPRRPRTLAAVTPQEMQPMRSEPISFRDAPVQNEKTITKKQLFDGIRKRHNITIRYGRLGVGDKNVLGYFKTNSEVIRTRRAGDVQVVAHEVGHALDKRYNLAQPQFDHELMPLGEETSGDGYTPQQVREEGIAEYIRLYLTDPQRAYQEAPNFTKEFIQKLPPKELKALQETQQNVDTWITQGGANRVRGQINRTGKDSTKTVSQRANDAYTASVDKLHPLAVVEKTINEMENKGSNLSDGSSSLYKKARLVPGAVRKAELFVEENLKPILKELGDKGYSLADLGDYAAAKHAMELENAWQRDFKEKVKAAAEKAAQDGKQLTLKDIRRIKEESRIESGFVRGDIQDTIQKFDTPEMQAIHQRLMKYNQSLIDMLVEGQVLSREAADAMRSKYPDYVPFYRYFDEDGGSFFGGGGGKGFADLTNPIKRLKGSTRDVIDPIESIIKNTFAAVQAVEKNKVGLELANLARVEGSGKFVERLTGDTRSPKENIVTVFENGERVQYQLDPELYRAMKQLDDESSNMLVKILSAPAGALRAGATLTPDFIVRNPIRDQFNAYVVSNYGYNPIIDLPAGIFNAIFKGKYYKEWVEAGGAHGQMVSMDRNLLRGELQKLKDERSPWKKAQSALVSPKQWVWLLRKLSELSEEGTKVGEFRRAVKRGVTPEEAAFQSRDLMDFARVGNNIKQINRVVSFLNANIQGKDRLVRAFKANPVRTTIRAITGVTLPTIGIYYLNKAISSPKQQETIDNAPQWLKDTFFLISVPGSDVVARIPKPFDLAPVFSNWVEEALRFADGKQHLDPGQTALMAAKELGSMPLMLTGLTPWIENMTNYSFFTGNPIVPRRDQDLLPEDQYGSGTSLTAREIGKMTNYSPYKVDNVIRGYAAGLGKYATAGTDAILEKTGIGKMPPAEQKSVSELPVINAFTVNYSGGKTMDDFYNRLDEMSRVEASNAKNKVKDAEAKKVSDDFQRTSRKISELRAKMRDIQSSYDIPPKEKRSQIDTLDQQITQLAAATLDRNKSYVRR